MNKSRSSNLGFVEKELFHILEFAEMPESGIRYFRSTENKYFDSTMKPLTGLQKTLFKEMKARIKEDDSSPPARRRKYFYYTQFKRSTTVT